MIKNYQEKKLVGPTQRQLRVGEQLRHVITDTLSRGHFHDEFLISNAGLVSVSEVRVSPDMKQATAFATMVGGKNLEVALASLNANADIFQREIGRQVRMKFTPRLKFVEDKLFDSASKIDALLHSLPKTIETE
ncbi:MAG: 30S ribosome-binding factor RbfA [Micavibrio sp.]|nr:30S ribosome-binding factor RbfA [Micavibrio sp.]